MSEPRLEDQSPEVLAVLVGELQRELAVVKQALAEALAEVALLRQALSEGRGTAPPKTPTNSSIPPAKGWKRNRRALPEAGEKPPKRGPKFGHLGTSRRRVAREGVDLVLPCRPSQCGHCQQPLSEQGGTVVGRCQVVELPPARPVVIEAQRVRVRCRRCGHGTVGSYPAGYGATGLFGPRLAATAAFLHEEQHIAYDRLVGVCASLFGLTVSEGALVEAVARVGTAVLPAAAVIAAAVRRAPVVGSDETSARVDGLNYWEWVFQTPDAAYHTIQRRRNTEVVLSFLAGRQPQVWVSDLWKPQLAAPTATYQICLAHQLRDLQDAIDAQQGEAQRVARVWAEAMAALLRRAIHLRNEQPQADRDDGEYGLAVTAIEAEGEALLRTSLPQGWSFDLQTRFCIHRAGLWTFLQRPDVPPTNNASERSLRPSVVHRKVTGGFRSESTAKGYAALRTVADTARKRGEDLFPLLLRALGPHLPITSRYALS